MKKTEKPLTRIELALLGMNQVIKEKKNLKDASLDLGLHFSFLSGCVGNNMNSLPATPAQKSRLNKLYMKYKIMAATGKIPLFFGGGHRSEPTRFPSVLRIANKRKRNKFILR